MSGRASDSSASSEGDDPGDLALGPEFFMWCSSSSGLALVASQTS
jgi:hypothetical protein